MKTTTFHETMQRGKDRARYLAGRVCGGSPFGSVKRAPDPEGNALVIAKWRASIRPLAWFVDDFRAAVLPDPLEGLACL